ncbi:T9SS C-terminal target domain-containing protein [Flavobacterium sp. TP390]|uniref:T9SS C-terminal target domain-containing protein n=1 Tax=Flavobacterium profundi TaxID=1774945 RepID=A0A6I4IT89_9FLAO|nr:CARDB domain-containing protein [Flavobacterium profundi]MVO10073.1 T9SS C-terminal target domain-containing protein [Flavobacterium profundi]
MKKIILFVLLNFSFSVWSQTSSYRYHELEDLGIYIENAISIHCAQTYAPYRILEVNFRQNYTLEVGKIYKADLGLSYGNFGTRYYRVKYAAGYGVDRGDEVDTPVNFGNPIDVCNALSWKYIRPILLGSTLQEAKDNYCSGQTANTVREKVNIKIDIPLTIGDVYLMDFGLGSNYYIIDGSNVEKGDSDYDLDTTSSTAVFSYISEATIDCPKPDLQANYVSLSGSTNVPAGSSKTANYQITNIGGYADASQCQFYLSKDDNVLSSNDVLIKQINITALNTNEIRTGSTTLTIPSNTGIGNYYIIMKVNNNLEINLNNNISTFSFSVTAPTGFADLILDINNSTAKSSGSILSPQALSSNASHTLYNNDSELELLLNVKNIGQANSGVMKVGFYYTQGTAYTNPILLKQIDFTEISSNNFQSQGEHIERNIISGYIAPETSGYIHIVLDINNNVNEGTTGGENNNIYSSILVYVSSSNRPNGSKMSIEKKQLVLQDNFITKSYNMNIYDFSGTLIKSSTVNSLKHEDEIIATLPTGLYIIKTPTETRKISR